MLLKKPVLVEAASPELKAHDLGAAM